MSTSPYRRLLAATIPAISENAVGRTESTSDIPIAWKLDLCSEREIRRLGYDTDLVPELADSFRQFAGEVDGKPGAGRALQFPGPPKPPPGRRRSGSVENGNEAFSVQEAFRGFQQLFLAIFDDLKNRHPACSTLRSRSYYLSHRSQGLDDVQLHLWSPCFPKSEIPVLQWSYEDSQVLDESAPLVEELSRSWTPVSIARGFPSPYRPISKVCHTTLWAREPNLSYFTGNVLDITQGRHPGLFRDELQAHCALPPSRLHTLCDTSHQRRFQQLLRSNSLYHELHLFSLRRGRAHRLLPRPLSPPPSSLNGPKSGGYHIGPIAHVPGHPATFTRCRSFSIARIRRRRSPFAQESLRPCLALTP